MKKYLIVFLLILVSCTFNEQKVIQTDIHSGIQGVEIEFLQSIPTEIWAGTDFEVNIKAKNMGAYNASNLIIRATGDSGYVTFEDENAYDEVLSIAKTTSIAGKTIYNPRSENYITDFLAKTKFADKGFEAHESTILSTICYDYSNKLATEICINPDPHNLQANEKNCELNSKTFNGQGGPVGIYKIEPHMLIKNKKIFPLLKITFKNFGVGEIFKEGNGDSFCSSKSVPKGIINNITLTKIQIGENLRLEQYCKPSPKNIIFRNGIGEIVCALPEKESDKALNTDISSYITSLTIESDYGYAFSDTKTIKIINPNY